MAKIIHAYPTKVGSEFVFNHWTVLVMAENLDTALAEVVANIQQDDNSHLGRDFVVEFKGLEVQCKKDRTNVLYKFSKYRVS